MPKTSSFRRKIGSILPKHEQKEENQGISLFEHIISEMIRNLLSI